MENIQGLTTLKIYGADGWKHEQMNEHAERFRKITMRVLTMQLNSVTLMDLLAYGGAALGIISAVAAFLLPGSWGWPGAWPLCCWRQISFAAATAGLLLPYCHERRGIGRKNL